MIWMPYGDDVPFILYGMDWASIIHDYMESIFADLDFLFPLKEKIIVAQDQNLIYTYHKWREREHGLGYLVYHVQLLSPPTLQEPKVEDIFHELPFWRVAHFVWIIAWGWEIHMGMIVPNISQITCLKKASRQHIVASMGVLLLHDDNYLGWSPKANLHTWEGQLGDVLMRQHLVPWRILLYEDATGRGEKALQFYPCSCLRTSNIWEGRTVIFLN